MQLTYQTKIRNNKDVLKIKLIIFNKFYVRVYTTCISKLRKCPTQKRGVQYTSILNLCIKLGKLSPWFVQVHRIRHFCYCSFSLKKTNSILFSTFNIMILYIINFLSKKLYWLSFIFPMNTLRGNPYKFIFENLYEEKIVLNPFLPQCRSLLLVLIHFSLYSRFSENQNSYAEKNSSL